WVVGRCLDQLELSKESRCNGAEHPSCHHCRTPEERWLVRRSAGTSGLTSCLWLTASILLAATGRSGYASSSHCRSIAARAVTELPVELVRSCSPGSRLDRALPRHQ